MEIVALVMNIRLFLLVIAAAVLVVGVGIWFGARQPLPPGAERVSAREIPVATPASVKASASVPKLKKATALNPGAPAEIPKWEMQIDQALRSNVNEAQTAQILLSMLPTLPPEGQVEAGHHISNLLADTDYSRVMPILLNPGTPEPVLSVFMTDLMNRSDPTKLRALLDVGKVANHPLHDEAMSTLQIFLGDDYGNDWAKWQGAMDKYLSEHAQPAPAN